MGFIKTVIQPEERECNLRQVRKTSKVDIDPNDAAKSTQYKIITYLALEQLLLPMGGHHLHPNRPR